MSENRWSFVFRLLPDLKLNVPLSTNLTSLHNNTFDKLSQDISLAIPESSWSRNLKSCVIETSPLLRGIVICKVRPNTSFCRYLVYKINIFFSEYFFNIITRMSQMKLTVIVCSVVLNRNDLIGSCKKPSWSKITTKIATGSKSTSEDHLVLHSPGELCVFEKKM